LPDVAAYTIDVRPRARRSLRQLDPSAQKAIAQVIDGLPVIRGLQVSCR
jgi:hypothetical protein